MKGWKKRVGKVCGLGVLFGLALGCCLMFSGCVATKGGPAVAAEDNPWHHYVVGMEAIDKGDLALAEKKFDRSLFLDKEFAPAFAGKALALAYRSRGQAQADHRAVDVENALKAIDTALDEMDGDEEKFLVNVTAIRVYTVAGPKRWLKTADKHYRMATSINKVDEAGLPYYRNLGAADYFMGMAVFQDDYRKAEPYFAKVLGARSGAKWQTEADVQYRKIQKIARVSTNKTLSDIARQVAVKESVSRADTSAILVDELQLDRLFTGRLGADTKKKVDYTPADILNHPFRSEIESVLKWNVRGLTPSYDKGTRAWLFNPQAPVTRKQLAFILEDVLIKITGDKTIATAMLGMPKSPFPDVPVNVAWFNPVMTSTSRGLMETGLSGEFRPDDPVEGADLLLAVFTLRNVLNIR